MLLTDNIKGSLRHKLFISFAASIVGLSFMFTAFFIYYQSKAVRNGMIAEGQMLSGLLAESTKTWVYAENRDFIGKACQGVFEQKDIYAVTVLSADKRLLYSEKKDPCPKRDVETLISWISGLDSRVSADAQGLVRETDNAMGVVSPVIMELPENIEEAMYFDTSLSPKKKEVIGYSLIIMNKENMNRGVRMVFFRNAALALVFFLSGIFIIYFSLGRLLKPLNLLTEEVKRLGLGEPIEKVKVHSDDEIGRLAGSFNVMSDNLRAREKEKAMLEEKLRHAEKMEAVGTLARGVAHDFNNILSTVRAAVYIIEKKLQDTPELLQYTERINDPLDRAKALVQGLLAFSRARDIKPSKVEINRLVGKLKLMITSIAGDSISVRIRPFPEEMTVLGDPVQIEQVLINLCMNARDAMPDGGEMNIATEIVEISSENSETPHLKPGKYAVIRVSDTGFGIDADIKDRIFEPFFTTKEVGKGTGLGLAIVYGIIEEHKGFIEVKTGKGEGTSFDIYFPLFD